MNLPQLPSRPKCNLCELEEKPIFAGIPAEWDVESLPPSPTTPCIVFIGGAPSSEEDRFGLPWVGQTGDVLRDVYVKGIYAREKASVYYMNLTRCRTGLGDPAPTAAIIKNCTPFLNADLDAIAKAHPDAPRILCLLGGHASKFFFKESITACAKKRLGRVFTYEGNEWTAIPTFNPGILLSRRDPNTAATIEGHLQIALNTLNGVHTDPAVVVSSGWRVAFEDGSVLSLDLETYGACWRSTDGRRLPRQTVFNAKRMVYQDRIHPKDVALTASLTEILTDPDNVFNPAFDHPSEIDFSKALVGMTKTYHLDDAAQRMQYIKDVKAAVCLVGQNLPYDIPVHREFLSKNITPESHFLVELQVVNYLECEVRLEKDLKSLSYILGNHHYDEDEGKFDHERYPDPHTPNSLGKLLIDYNAEDTHVTAANLITLCQRILEKYPNTDKLSPVCMSKFSSLVWECIAMAEVGVGYSHRQLRFREAHLRQRIARCERLAVDRYGLLLSGKGSQKSKEDFLDRVIEKIDEGREKSILNDPRLERTKKAKKISFNDVNRNLFTLELDPEDELLAPLKLCRTHNRAVKILGSFIYPLLYHQKNQPKNKKSLGLPIKAGWKRPFSPEQHAKRLTAKNKRNKVKGKKKVEPKDPAALALFDPLSASPPSDILTTYPTWYPVPSADEGDSEAGGGTQQGRITCKNHSVQTDPPELQRAMASRHRFGQIIGVDLSQIELRTSGLISGEPSIITAYRDHRDLHWERAEEIFNLPEEFGEGYRSNPKCKYTRRQPAKTVNFGDLFLAMAKTLQLQVLARTGLYIPIEVFQLAVDQRPEVRPQLCAWQEKLITQAIQDGYIELPITGQSRLFVGSPVIIEETYASTIVNFPVQCTASNFLQEIVREMRKELPDWTDPRAWVHIICNKYDAIYFDVRSPMYIDDVKAIWNKAFIEVVTRGYWARLQEHYGNEVLVEYEW